MAQQRAPQRFNFVRSVLRFLITFLSFAVPVTAAIVITRDSDIDIEETNVIVLVLLAMLAVISAVISQWQKSEYLVVGSRAWWGEFFAGVSTEMVGAIMTGVLVLFIVEAAEQQDLEDRLVRQAGSPAHAVAIDAMYDLNSRGLLTGENSLLIGATMTRADLHSATLRDINLRGATLDGADLSDADFSRTNLQGGSFVQTNLSGATLRFTQLQNAAMMRANLQRADLTSATLTGVNLSNANMQNATVSQTDLSGANMQSANLQSAVFSQANLTGVDLQTANLSSANLGRANLTDAIMKGANLNSAVLQNTNLQNAILSGSQTILQNANLTNASLEGAILTGATFNENTTLPDGTFWTPDVDLGRFTNPTHPEYWRSTSIRSPAYSADP